MAANAFVQRRIYIGNLHPSVTSSDLVSKFQSFGTCSDAIIPIDSNTNLGKGYGFITLSSDLKGWERCLGILNGSKWKGGKLKLELAVKDSLKVLEEERLGKDGEEEDVMVYKEKKELKNKDNKNKPEKSTKKKSDKPARKWLNNHEIPDMTLMTDDKVEEREGWKKARFGRAVAELKIRRPDNVKVVVDPIKYQHQLKSFKKKEDEIDEEIDNVKVDKLTWFINEDDEMTDLDNEVEEKIIDKVIDKTELAKQRQLASIAEKSDRLMAQKQVMHQALAGLDGKPKINLNKIRFGSDGEEADSEEGEEKDNDPDEEVSQVAINANKDDTKVSDLFADSDNDEEALEPEHSEQDLDDTANNQFLFSDDDDEASESRLGKEEENIGVKAVFEGLEGQKRLNLQRRFGNDSRFKLDDAFIDSGDDESPLPTHGDKALGDEDDEVQKDLAEEKGKNLDLLNQLLGLPSQQHQMQRDKQREMEGFAPPEPRRNTGIEWKEMVRYDPDASDAEELEVDPSELAPITQAKKQKLTLEPIDKAQAKPISLTKMPEVSKDKHFAVSETVGNIFTKDLNKKDTGNFSLFGLLGDDDAQEDNDDEQGFFGFAPTTNQPTHPIITTTSTSQQATNPSAISTYTEPLFFYHFDTTHFFKPRFDGEPVFQRTQSIEQLDTELNQNRRTLITQYKSRFRQAQSHKRKRTTR